MTTPLLPTRAQLADIRLTPAQLIRDAQVERILISPEYLEFITRVMTGFRNGQNQTTWTAPTAASAAILRTILVEYGYWVDAVDPERLERVTVSWNATDPFSE